MKKMSLVTALAVSTAMLLAGCGSGSGSSAAASTAASSADAAATTAAAAAATESTASGDPFRVGMECNYAPFNWTTTTQNEFTQPISDTDYADGYDVVIAARMADALGRPVQIVKLDWDNLILSLQNNQIDAIIAGMTDTPEREQEVAFTSPYYTSEEVMIVRADSDYASATSIQDFSGASVLGQRDTMLDTVIDQIEGVNHLTAVASVPDMIARLNQGACDAITVNMESVPVYLAANPDFVAISFEEGQGFELGFTGSCVGLRKSEDALLGLVNEALATVNQETRDAMWDTAVNTQPN